ncbi:acyl carrier protein [Streptomyces sp. UP1A-1]|nr:acyl carrier protein [Streptomyces sp. UP1A-1]
MTAERGFLDMGLDSLAALELRNRLSGATGERLPATLIYDCPTVVAVAEFLRTEMVGERPETAAHATGTTGAAAAGGVAARRRSDVVGRGLVADRAGAVRGGGECGRRGPHRAAAAVTGRQVGGYPPRHHGSARRRRGAGSGHRGRVVRDARR